VIVLTAHDFGEQNTKKGIQKLLWPFCRDKNDPSSSIPRTVVFGKAAGAGKRINAIINEYHAEYTGLAMLLNRSQIEFAAVTDEPVLLLGESGTGKEHLASSIRRSWEREKKISEPANSGYAVLNCGCITDTTAHAHLFGSVRGAATGFGTHEPGVLLQAAGCRSLGYEMPDERHIETLVKALRHAESCSEAVEQMGRPENVPRLPVLVRTYITQLRELLYPTTSAQGLQGSRKHSLPQVLDEVKTHLQDLIEGTAEAAQFKHKLLAHFGEHLVEGRSGRELEREQSTNPYDLCFTKEAGVLGTLFLDEFADLPTLAQSLLLRFLESGTREIQPLGYPGVISGVRLRIIAATSDDEVARKAGVFCEGDTFREPIPGEIPFKRRPDGRARAFPVRFDLVQRLRYHTIRVEPVTGENARRTIESMIRTKDGVRWETGAIDALEAYAKEEAGKDTFNHRRELRRIIVLATLLVTKDRQLGMRGFEVNKVTKDVVERFLIAASAVSPESVSVEPPKTTSGEEELTNTCQATLEKVKIALKLDEEKFKPECGPKLMKMLRKTILASDDPTTKRDAVREVFKDLTDNTGRSEQQFNYKVLRKLFGYDDAILPGKRVSDFFNKLIPKKKAHSKAPATVPTRSAKKQPSTEA
jgi:hypothetical protein